MQDGACADAWDTWSRQYICVSLLFNSGGAEAAAEAGSHEAAHVLKKSYLDLQVGNTILWKSRYTRRHRLRPAPDPSSREALRSLSTTAYCARPSGPWKDLCRKPRQIAEVATNMSSLSAGCRVLPHPQAAVAVTSRTWRRGHRIRVWQFGN